MATAKPIFERLTIVLFSFQVKFVLLKLLTSQSSQCQTTSDWAKLNVVALSLLSVLDKLDPGASRNRGKVLKDLIKPFMKLAECELKAGVIDESDFKIRKKMAQQFAKDLINCYKHENVLQSNKNTALSVHTRTQFLSPKEGRLCVNRV